MFLGEDYLIKGVAGAVLWLMARDHVEHGRTQFTNRELRLDPRLRLPEIGDNLEARLVLLQRRLADRAACIRLDKAGRGRLRLTVHRPLPLLEVRCISNLVADRGQQMRRDVDVPVSSSRLRGAHDHLAVGL